MKICGILYKGKNSTTIGLNARRSLFGQNFDCMHELIHYWFHDRRNFLCPTPGEDAHLSEFDAHLEWQANEGAAQFLMPYQSFIPNYSKWHDHYYSRLSPENAGVALVDHLAKAYLVGQKAAEYRINGLSKEISQFLDGIPIPKIKILARHS
jgi:Zn-dependent peptidase ImmA (M78 family)